MGSDYFDYCDLILTTIY